MFSHLFDTGNTFWRNFTRVMDLFGLSLCWLVCSALVVTAGPATTALYDGVYHGVRLGEEGVYVRFFTTLRRELKTGMLITLPGLGLVWLHRLFLQVSYTMAITGSDTAGVLAYAYQVLFCVPLAVWLFACATLSRFTFTPLALMKAACKLVFLHLPSAAAVTAAVVFSAKVMLWWPISIIFLPALTALAASLFLERVFAPYL